MSRQTLPPPYPPIPESPCRTKPSIAPFYAEHAVFVEQRELGQCVSECSWTESIMSPFLSGEACDVPPHRRRARGNDSTKEGATEEVGEYDGRKVSRVERPTSWSCVRGLRLVDKWSLPLLLRTPSMDRLLKLNSRLAVTSGKGSRSTLPLAGPQLQPPIHLFVPEKGNIIGANGSGWGSAAGDTERKRRLSHVHSVLILRPTKES